MDELKRGGLIKKTKKDDRVPTLLLSGVSYVPRAAAEKYGLECFRKLSGVEEIILIEDEKSS